LLAPPAIGPTSADPGGEPSSRQADGDGDGDGGSAGGSAGDCALTGFENNRVTARCRVRRPGVAVFIEQFDPGWRATVDGRPTPLQRANALLRAVSLDRGAHDIVLSYTPPAALGAGAGVSLAAATLLLAIAALARVARRRRERAGPAGWRPSGRSARSDPPGLPPQAPEL
jgi:hypothetical protein